MGIALRIIANLLKIAFSLPALVHELIDGIRYKDFKERINQTSESAAFAIDVYCNVAYKSLLNAFFIRKGGYHYGEQGEAVTSATGKNWTINKLTLMGEGLCGCLNIIDQDHCYKYIEGNWPDYPMPARVAHWKSALFFVVFLVLFFLSLWLVWWLVQEGADVIRIKKAGTWYSSLLSLNIGNFHSRFDYKSSTFCKSEIVSNR